MSGPSLHLRTGRRRLQRVRADLSDRDLAVLHAVAEFRFLTTRHVQQLHFPPHEHTSLGAARCARRVLHRLTTLRVLTRLERLVGGVRAGSAAHTYAVGPVGARLLGRNRPPVRHREPSTRFLDHGLAVADLFVNVVEAARADRLELVDYETEPVCWRQYVDTDGAPTVLRPDLRLTVARGPVEWHWFCEVDLGTEHLPAVLRKCRQYAAYYRISDREQRRHGVFPRVAWLTTDPGRAAKLADAIAADPDLPERLFAVGTLEGAVALLTDAEAQR